MQSKMSLRNEVVAKKMDVAKALSILEKISGGKYTQTYRRLKRLAK